LILLGYVDKEPKQNRDGNRVLPLQHSFQHDLQIVPQKHLTLDNYRGTVIMKERI
jgi:hypothetical protein